MGLLEHCIEFTTPPFASQRALHPLGAKSGQGGFEVPEVLNPPQSPFYKGGSQSAFSIVQMF